MAHKGTGFWVGAGLLVASACAHTNPTASNANTAGTQPTPVASDNNPAATNTSPPSAQTDQSGASADNSAPAAGSSDSTTADNAGSTAGQAADSNEVASNDTTASTGSDSTPAPSDTGAAADNSTTGAASADTTSRNVAQQKSDIISSADGSQPGIVQDYSYGELTIAPQGKQHKARTGARSVLSIDDKVPVFQGNTRASTNDLTPGTDIRVYYKNPVTGNEKEVIGVDIIAPAPADRTVTPDSATQPAPGDSTTP